MSEGAAENEEEARLPVSALNHLSYCERRCALIHIEGVFVENAFTLEGTHAHEAADRPGYEIRKGARAVHALPLLCRRLSLTGKADIVEFSPDQSGREIPFPVEYKRGRRKRWENDDLQLCAQALCLEEMLDVPVPRGAIFHATTRRRREVNFTKELRRQTEAAARRLHELIASGRIPPATLLPKCEGCSLHEICMPELATRAGAIRTAAEQLFEPQV